MIITKIQGKNKRTITKCKLKSHYSYSPFIYRCASYALNSLDSNTGASFKRSGFSQKDTRSCVLPGLCLSPAPL